MQFSINESMFSLEWLIWSLLFDNREDRPLVYNPSSCWAKSSYFSAKLPASLVSSTYFNLLDSAKHLPCSPEANKLLGLHAVHPSSNFYPSLSFPLSRLPQWVKQSKGRERPTWAMLWFEIVSIGWSRIPLHSAKQELHHVRLIPNKEEKNVLYDMVLLINKLWSIDIDSSCRWKMSKSQISLRTFDPAVKKSDLQPP